MAIKQKQSYNKLNKDFKSGPCQEKREFSESL